MSEWYWKQADDSDVGRLCRAKDLAQNIWCYGVLLAYTNNCRYRYLISMEVKEEEVFEVCEVQSPRDKTRRKTPKPTTNPEPRTEPTVS